MAEPGIGVVIPCWNLGHTVEEAVDSALAQTRPPAEVVVIDDGSTDWHTRQVLGALERPRTRVVRAPHEGVAAARNRGVRLTTAPLVLLLDADDVLEPEALAHLGGRLDERPDLAFVSCAVQAFGEASYTWTPPPCTFVDQLARGSAHVSSLFRRELFEAVGGFDVALPGYEDMDFWLSALERGLAGEVLPQALLRYRIRAGSRYRRALEPDLYAEAMQRIHEKHADTVRAHGPALLLAKEELLLDLQDHARHLEDRQRTVAAEREALRVERRDLVQQGRGVVLAYHRVATHQPDTHALCVPPALFEAHMRWLALHQRPMSLASLAQAARTGQVPAGAVAVTVDDGYLDALTEASPVLQRHGIPATFFINGEPLADGREFWWDTLERVLLGDLPLPAPLVVAAGGVEATWSCATRDDRRAALSGLHALIFPMGAAERDAVVAQVARWSGAGLMPRDSHRPLRAEEVAELARRPGHDVGAHTVHHLVLPVQPRPVQRAEIGDNRRQLESLTGRAVRSFCYPYGEAAPATTALVREAGFEVAVTCMEGAVSATTDPLLLPRLEVKAWSTEMLAARLEEAFAR